MGQIWRYRKTIYSIFFIVLIFISAPAQLLTSLVHRTVPQLWLAEAQGSFWQGRVSKAIVTVDGSSIDLGRLEWSLKPLSLFYLQPALELTVEKPRQTLAASLSIGFGGVRLSNVQGELPLALAQSWVPLLINGHVFYDIEAVTFSGGELESIHGKLNLRDVIWQGGDELMPLGDYQANIEGQEQVIDIKVSDQQARLGIEGDVQVKMTGGYSVRVQMSPQASLHESIIQSLSWIGKPQANGEVLIDRKGRWK